MDTQLSPWWKRSLILLIVSGFSVLGYLAARTYRDAPPVPKRVAEPAGATLFTGQDIIVGQQIFLSHGLMENGSIWGHGAYLGPDFSAEYLHTMALDILASVSGGMSSNAIAAHPNDPNERDAEVASTLKENRYEPTSDTLTFTEAEADSFKKQQQKWRDYFSVPGHNGGLTAGLIQNPEELRKLTAFFAWAAWASAARRPGEVTHIPTIFRTISTHGIIRVGEGDVGPGGQRVALSRQWTFYFLMAVGFWNFVGAGVFGFLINMPIVSYFEVGTILTPNHGHASFMGVFGMLGVALLVFACREATDEASWPRIEKWVRISLWGLNLGLASMIIFSLFPGGVMQLYDAAKRILARTRTRIPGHDGCSFCRMGASAG